MSTKYDIIVMGGGVNTLGAAAYMAKAGKKVLVLEKSNMIGGGAVTVESTIPGFRHDTHSTSHVFIHASPLLQNDELGLLSKFGLKYNYSTKAVAGIFEDNTSMVLDHSVDDTCNSIAKHSERDAETYRKFAAMCDRVLPMFLMGSFTVPTPMGSFISILEQSDDGRNLLDLMLKSPLQILNGLFENDKVKMFFLKVLCIATLQMPDAMGTGLAFLTMPAFIHKYKFGRPVGGSALLPESLARCIEYYGGTIIKECEVTKIVTSGGRATGVDSKNGRYEAKDAVIAAIHPRHLGKMVDGLSPNLLERAKNVQPADIALLKIDAAMNEPLKYNGDPEDVAGGGIREMFYGNSLREHLASYDVIRQGKLLWDKPFFSASNSAGADATRCPPGKGVLYSCTYVPYNLLDGGPQKWDEIKQRVAENTLEKAAKFIPNIKGNILGMKVSSPLDMERHSPSFVDGEIAGLGFQFFHTGGLRPLPELAQFAVPDVESLYLCGPFMHPGGGIFGVGRPTAIKVCEDLGIDFDSVVAGNA